MIPAFCEFALLLFYIVTRASFAANCRLTPITNLATGSSLIGDPLKVRLVHLPSQKDVT